MNPDQFQKALLDWYDIYGRKDLPWQHKIDPYRVWLSEIMLQQTQVGNVIPYFTKFIARFPNVHHLAIAELDEVLSYWAGLGYYARARNLHKTAKLVVAAGGKFPDTITELNALPGIGRSTAGAILSIAYKQSEPILDGNVKRVLARFHAIRGWPGDGKIQAKLWEISKHYTPKQRTAAYTQAIMDLGATLCTPRQPSCEICPVAIGCQAFKSDMTSALPEPKPRKNKPVKQLFVLILQNIEKCIFLEKRPPYGIWGGLWSLPEFDEYREISTWCSQHHFTRTAFQTLATRKHDFSHYQLEYTPVFSNLLQSTDKVTDTNTSLWHNTTEIKKLGLPAPIKRLLNDTTMRQNDDQNG